jgi:SAM-dependent methyltransferase
MGIQADFWRGRYQTGETPWDLGGPSPHFQDWLTHRDPEAFPVGKMAVLGAGRGHDAALFARAGFDVTGFDYAPEAVAEALRLYAQIDLGKIRFEAVDIFDLAAAHSPWTGAFDYVLEHTCFCAITPAERPAYVRSVRNILKPGGQLLGVFWEHAEKDGPPFSTPPSELRAAFAEGFECLSMEDKEPTPGRSGTERLVLIRRI